jgi:hypothetical protein
LTVRNFQLVNAIYLFIFQTLRMLSFLMIVNQYLYFKNNYFLFTSDEKNNYYSSKHCHLMITWTNHR